MNIAIITSSFPFRPGEQFIEVEIDFWKISGFKQVYLLPSSGKGRPRPIPSNILLDRSLSNNGRKVTYVLLALFSRYFYNEIMFLLNNKKLTLRTIVNALKSTATFIRAKKNLFGWLNSHPSIDLIYTYWNSDFAYAACVAKKKGLIRQVVSRAHGFDLYEGRRPEHYMPLKRQFIHEVDRLYVLSSEAKGYAQSVYRLEPEKCEVSPLGVFLPEETSKPSDAGVLHIVSVSFCVPVKRIDKIVESIALFASGSTRHKIKWTHIGDGPLKRDIEELANKRLKSLENVTWMCIGHLSNEDVKSFYLENHVDCFINVSESEGIPVSIMEAMAAGVPAIAPDVGGISELVSNDCGYLLTERAEVDEIVTAISCMSGRVRDLSFRRAAREKIARKFHADKNYGQFIDMLEKLVASNQA